MRDTVIAICEEFAEGDKSLRQLCKDHAITKSLFLKQIAQDKELRDHYARAVDIANDLRFESLFEAQKQKPAIVEGRVDLGWVNWKRLQIDTLKWELSKRNPRKYGDRIQNEHTGENGGPIQIVSTIPRPPKE